MSSKLSYTGKLFRRIAICCGAWTENPHKIWENHLAFKYIDEYHPIPDFIYARGQDGKWHPEMVYDDREFWFWQAMRWLEENGYIERQEGTYRFGHHKYYRIGHGTEIRLTEKGLAAAPAYLKIKED